MAHVKITGLHKRFGAVSAVRGIDLDIGDGEFAVLVGPSGCGKSTLLRTIAGLEDADEGEIEIGGEVVNDMRPRDRDVAMVFQDYALYPHMTAGSQYRVRPQGAENVEGRDRRAGRARRGDARHHRRCSAAIRASCPAASASASRSAAPSCAIPGCSCSTSRCPISMPSCATQMRGEIKQLHQKIATTMIYVTHDQIEAMTLAERIVLMRDGVIEQQGAPLDLFERPASRFVAGFLGSPQMSFLPGRLVRSAAGDAVRLGEAGPTFALPRGRKLNGGADGTAVLLGLRPEHMTRAHGTPGEGDVRHDATIELIQPTGSRSYATFRLAGEPVMAELQAHDVSRPGEKIAIDINLTRASLFDAATEKAM